MTKIKLVNGTIINAETVEVVNGLLMISTKEHSVEELAELFSNKENTSMIVLMTPSEKETGYKKGFTSFAGINYDLEGVKTIELFQPADITEARISNAEGVANQAIVMATEIEGMTGLVEERVAKVEEGQEIQDEAIVELAGIVIE